MKPGFRVGDSGSGSQDSGFGFRIEVCEEIGTLTATQ